LRFRFALLLFLRFRFALLLFLRFRLALLLFLRFRFALSLVPAVSFCAVGTSGEESAMNKSIN
jgi:hypothetical protein